MAVQVPGDRSDLRNPQFALAPDQQRDLGSIQSEGAGE